MTARRGLGLVALLLVAVAAGVLVVAPALDDGSGGTSSTTTTVAGTTTSTAGSATPTTTSEEGTPLPLGTVQDTGQPSGPCPEGFDCSGFTVDACASTPGPLAGDLAVKKPDGTPAGVVVLLSGGSGTDWWDEDRPEARAFFDDLLAEGIEVVQARWATTWFESDTGAAMAGCRPATLVRHVYDQEYAPLGLGRGDGVCGFCVSGNSAGGDQLSLSLSFYGLSSIIDVAVPTGGPPRAGMARGCIQAPEDRDLAYSRSQAADIDRAFGQGRNGPCVRRDASFTETWNSNDAAFGGNDLSYDSTWVVVIAGGADKTLAPLHGRIYYDQLKAAGSPHVELVEVPELPHGIGASPEGLAALRTALLGG